MALTDKLTAIGDAIRGITSSTDLIPLAEMPNKVYEVHSMGVEFGNQNGYNNGYDDGMSKAESDFWDNVQQSGARTNYGRAFRFWANEYIMPKHKITAKGDVVYLFCDCAKLKTVDRQYFDFSDMKPTFSSQGDVYAMFCRCSELEYVPDLGIPACSVGWLFTYCYKLHTIDVLRVSEKTTFDSTFSGCEELRNITIEGTIGQNGLQIDSSPNLTHASLMSIINALKTFTDGTTRTVTLGATNIAKLTDAEKAIATQKGWTLA